MLALYDSSVHRNNQNKLSGYYHTRFLPLKTTVNLNHPDLNLNPAPACPELVEGGAGLGLSATRSLAS